MAVDQRILGITVMMTFNGQGTMNQVNQSLTNTAQVAQRGGSAFSSMGRQSGFLSNQLYILRRSFMYAVAGLSLYRIYAMTKAWQSFRTELGQVNTTLQLTGNQLTSLGQAAINVSNQTGQSLSDVMASFQNLAQSYPKLSPKNIAKFSTTEAMTANILGAAPQNVGSTVGALASAYYGRNAVLGPKGPQLINEIADMLVRLQKSGLPNVSGEDILSAASNLTGGAIVGRFSLPEALSMFAAFQRAFPSSSKASLYLRQLMTRIITPTQAESAYYSQAGLPTGTALAGVSGYNIVQDLLKAAIAQPGANMTYAQAQKAGFKNVTLGPAGTELIEKAIGGRIQSGIAMSLLVRSFGQLLPEQTELQKALNPQAAQQDLTSRQQTYLAQKQFSLAANRLANLSVGLIDDMNPVIQEAGKMLGALSGYMVSANNYAKEGSRDIDHLINDILPKGVARRVTGFGGGGIAEIAGGTVAVLALRKLIGGSFSGALKDGLSHLPLLGKRFAEGEADVALGRTFGKAATAYLEPAEISSAFAGAANGSPQNPFWVVISPLSSAFFNNLGGGLSNAASNLDTAAHNLPGDIEKAIKGHPEKAGSDVLKTIEDIAKSPLSSIAGFFGAKKAGRWVKKFLGKSGDDIGGDVETAAGDIADAGAGAVGDTVRGASALGDVAQAAAEATAGVGEAGLTAVGATIAGGLASVAGALFSAGSAPVIHTRAGKDPLLSALLGTSNPAPPGFWHAETAYAKKHGVGQNPFGNQAMDQYLESWLADQAKVGGAFGINPQHFINNLAAQKMVQSKYGKGVLQQLLQVIQSEGYNLTKVPEEHGSKGVGRVPPSFTSINRMLQQAQLGQQTQYIAAAASTVAGTVSGVLVPDQIDATFNLAPTAELAGMLKPQKIRTPVKLRWMNTNSPAPTSRGKTVNRNT